MGTVLFSKGLWTALRNARIRLGKNISETSLGQHPDRKRQESGQRGESTVDPQELVDTCPVAAGKMPSWTPQSSGSSGTGADPGKADELGEEFCAWTAGSVWVKWTLDPMRRESGGRDPEDQKLSALFQRRKSKRFLYTKNNLAVRWRPGQH